MITFKQLKIEGFKSYGDEVTIPLDNLGVVVIEGANGAGKTTIFEALCWCLYGSEIGILKERIPTREKYRSKNFAGTMVSVQMEIDNNLIEIVRCIEYQKEVMTGILGATGVYLFKDGEMSPLRSMKDVQAQIEAYLGIGFEQFMLCVYLPQSGKSFLTSSTKEKGDLLNSIFDFSWVDEAQIKAKNAHTGVLNDLKEATDKVAKSEQGLALIIRDKEAQEQAIAAFKANKIRRTQELKDDIASFQTHVDTVTKEKKEIELKLIDFPVSTDDEQIKKSIKEAKQVHNTIISKMCNLEVSLERNDRELKQLLSNGISVMCNNCNQPLPEDTQKELLQKHENNIANIHVNNAALNEDLDNAKAILVGVTNDISNLEDELSKVTVGYGAIKQLQAEVSTKDSVISNYQTQIDRYTTQLKELSLQEMTKKDFDTLIDAINNTIAEKTAEVVKIKGEIEPYEYWATKGFGNKGLKSYLIQETLKSLNEVVKEAASLLGWVINLSINTESANKNLIIQLFTSAGEEVDYNTLSGGESRRIELAVTFALQALQPIKTNLMVLDEPNHHLDEDGVYKVFEIIRAKLKTYNTILVTAHTHIDLLGVNKWKAVKTFNGSILDM